MLQTTLRPHDLRIALVKIGSAKNNLP